MNPDACYKIGYVAKTHGLKGEVTMVTLPDCPDISGIDCLFLSRQNSMVPYFIKASSPKADKIFIKFDGVDTIEQATELKGQSVFLAITDRPKLSRGEFYNDEVVGFEVNDADQTLGNVREVMEAGPNRFLVLDYNNKEILIPVTGPFIKSINKSRKKITVELPDGFLDI